jgi:hypothetical protein
MGIIKRLMKFWNSKTKITGAGNMWPYTDEEADFLNGKLK